MDTSGWRSIVAPVETGMVCAPRRQAGLMLCWCVWNVLNGMEFCGKCAVPARQTGHGSGVVSFECTEPVGCGFRGVPASHTWHGSGVNVSFSSSAGVAKSVLTTLALPTPFTFVSCHAEQQGREPWKPWTRRGGAGQRWTCEGGARWLWTCGQQPWTDRGRTWQWWTREGGA